VQVVGTWPQNVKKIHFRRFAPQRESFDRFLQMFGAFVRPTSLQKCFKFEVIRFIDYGVIDEKPHASRFPSVL